MGDIWGLIDSVFESTVGGHADLAFKKTERRQIRQESALEGRAEARKYNEFQDDTHEGNMERYEDMRAIKTTADIEHTKRTYGKESVFEGKLSPWEIAGLPGAQSVSPPPQQGQAGPSTKSDGMGALLGPMTSLMNSKRQAETQRENTKLQVEAQKEIASNQLVEQKRLIDSQIYKNISDAQRVNLKGFSFSKEALGGFLSNFFTKPLWDGSNNTIIKKSKKTKIKKNNIKKSGNTTAQNKFQFPSNSMGLR